MSGILGYFIGLCFFSGVELHASEAKPVKVVKPPAPLAATKLSANASTTLKFSTGSVTLQPQVFEYQIEPDGTFKMGALTIKQDDLSASVEKLPSNPLENLTFTWPRDLFWHGTIDIENNEKVLFSITFGSTDVIPQGTVTKFSHPLEDSEAQLLLEQRTFRYCMQGGEGQSANATRVCSPLFKISKTQGGLEVKAKKVSEYQYVIIQHKKSKNKGQLPLDDKGSIVFEAYIKNGTQFNYEIKSSPPRILEAHFNSNFVTLKGEGPIPIGRELFFVKGNQWQIEVPLDLKALYFRTPENAFVRQDLHFERIKVKKKFGLNFSLERNGVVVGPQKLTYDWTPQGDVRMGQIELHTNAVEIKLIKPDPKKDNFDLQLAWPNQLLNHGTLQLKGPKTVLFSRDLPEEDRSPDEPELKIFTEHLSGGQIQDLEKTAEFYFCVKAYPWEPSASVCSRHYRMKDNRGKPELEVASKDLKKLVKINGTDSTVPGSTILSAQTKMNLEFFTPQGTYLYYQVSAVPLKFVDIVDDEGKVNLTGASTGPLPAGRYQKDNDLWVMTFPDAKKPQAHFWSENRFVIFQEFQFKKTLPTDAQRIQYQRKMRHSTYLDRVPLHIWYTLFADKKDYRIDSQEFEAKLNPSKNVNWAFQAPERGKTNRSHINFTDKTGRYALYDEIYRGYPLEGVVKAGFLQSNASNSLIAYSELFGSAWLEQFFKSEHPIASVQRWGVSLGWIRYFSLFKYAETDNLQLINLHLHYRLNPGLYDIDQGFGATLAFEHITHINSTALIMGMGGFYVGAWPHFLGHGLDLLSRHHWKKTFEVKAAIYPIAMTNTTSVGLDWSLTGQGRVFLTDNFFWLTSWEMRQTDVNILGNDQFGSYTADPVQALSLALIAGVGWKF